VTEELRTKDQRFREHIPLELAGFKAEFFVNDLGQHVAIIREHAEGDIRLFVREASALRDWLNKVLP
jgi:hypothetical protein